MDGNDADVAAGSPSVPTEALRSLTAPPVRSMGTPVRPLTR